MVIWLGMLAPLAGTLVMAYFYHQELTYWELVLPVAVGALLIAGLRKFITHLQISDTEYWTGYGVRVEFYEEWNERVPCTHAKYRTNQKGERVFAGFKHAYDVRYHSPYWQIVDNNGLAVEVSRKWYHSLWMRWNPEGKQTFKDMRRDYHTIDGDMYYVDWDGSEETMEVVTTEHSYENRPQASDGTFSWREISEEEQQRFALFDYPEVDHYSSRSILGSRIPGLEQAERELSIWNARLGKKKEVKLLILLYDGQSKAASEAQEEFWLGGNKNELVVCIGLGSDNAVQWNRVFSWSDDRHLVVQTEDELDRLRGEPLDLSQFVAWLGPKTDQLWERKSFSDFEYLSVRPPLWAVLTSYVVLIAMTVGLVYWCTTNEFVESSGSRYEHSR